MDETREKRTAPRKVPLHSLRVIDTATDEEIGWVIDITLHGMRLFAPADRSVPAQLRLRIELPANNDGCPSLEVESRRIWYHPDEDTGRAQLGIEFAEALDEEQSRVLAELIYRHCA
jgi:hypothetical protein